MSCGRSRFPDPRGAPADAPLAVGDDLSPETLVDAYRHGVFPWPAGAGQGPVWWWSPDPRALFVPGSVHVSRSLRRTLRSGRFHTTSDRAFSEVVTACAQRPGEGTWITTAMQQAYAELHSRGFAHSVEVWDDDQRLVGGIYGVAVGGAFCGESMFHRATDASKVALIVLTEHLWSRGYAFLDAQVPHPHLTSLGAVSVSRKTFLDALDEAVRKPGDW